ncbi:hypothetical protein [Pseudomonas sp. GW101-3H06]|jgi:hypothetical protein|uniref:hypothetical protein n=1 Tax=Pseudomonas sp. GW101-3H06 TaxID=2751347 RepID=UPI001A92415F|nr:hypothetical protein [Pseudomonas sp. GW101-3H06]
MFARSALASKRNERYLQAGRKLLVTSCLLGIVLTSSALNQQVATPDQSPIGNTDRARFEIGEQSLDAARKAYPAAALVPASVCGAKGTKRSGVGCNKMDTVSPTS